jgi:hypothetical protein
MLELLSTLTITQILFYLFLIFLGIKEGLELIDYFKKRNKKGYDKENETQNLINTVKRTDERMNKIADKIEGVKGHFNEKFEKQERILSILIDSDKDDIRGWIVEKHHFYIAQGWIDDFSMDCIEKRYAHYKDEGGNSYISGLVHELRKLPKQPQ